MAMVRSPHAHARILSIDTQAADDSTNVYEVFTGDELADEQGVLPNAWPITADQKAPPHLPVAIDRVAFAGDIVAVVVARTPAEARDAAELVDVEYEVLPAVLDLKEAADDKVLAHPDLGTNKSALWQFDSGEAGTGRSVDEAIAKAREDGIVIEREYRQQRLIPAFMEPRSVLVDPTGEQITMWTSTQIPHVLRFLAAAVLGIPESKLRVIAPDVGGGFGGKLQTTPEEFLSLVIARRLGKPVKYTETRSESLMAAHHGRAQWQKLTLAAEKDGTVTGLKVELLADMGSYVSLLAGGHPDPRRVHVQRDLQVRQLPVQLPDGAHQHRLDRRLPRRRPAGGDVRHRADHGRARRRGGRRPAWRSARRTGSPHEEFPFTTVCGHHLRLGQLRGGHRQGHGDVRVRRAAGRAEASAGSAATGSSWASASRRSPSCAAGRRPRSSAPSPTAPAAGTTPRSG